MSGRTGVGRPIIVEFVGLPASGKTTVARLTAAALASRGYRCSGRHPVGGGRPDGVGRLLRGAAVLVRRPGEVVAALRYGMSVHPWTRAHVKFLLQFPAWRERLAIARRGSDDLVLLDEGIVQNAWATLIGTRTRDDESLARMVVGVLERTGLPLVFVYFDVAIDVAVERISRRGNLNARFDRMASDDARVLLTAHKRDLEGLLQQTVERTGGVSLRVDASGPAAASAVALTETLVGLVLAPSGAGGGSG